MYVFIGVALVAAGLLIMLVGKLASDGRLKRNHFVGIRTRGTKATDEAWHAAHRAAWPALFWAGVAGVVVGLTLAILQPGGPDSIAMIGIGVFSVVALVFAGTKNATRAAAKVAAEAS